MKRPQGTCPVCSRVISLYRNGTLHDHGTGYSAFCSGARRLPTKESMLKESNHAQGKQGADDE